VLAVAMVTAVGVLRLIANCNSIPISQHALAWLGLRAFCVPWFVGHAFSLSLGMTLSKKLSDGDPLGLSST
jgi:hypothetical protein